MTLANPLEQQAVESEQIKQTLLLRALLERTAFLDPATAASRVTLISGTVTTVTTVTTLSNITSVGGWLATADQYVQMSIPYSSLRTRIVVT